MPAKLPPQRLSVLLGNSFCLQHGQQSPGDVSFVAFVAGVDTQGPANLGVCEPFVWTARQQAMNR